MTLLVQHNLQCKGECWQLVGAVWSQY